MTTKVRGDAIQYDGTFPLDFLRDGEIARGDGSGAMFVEDPEKTTTVRVDVGGWIMRAPDGRLSSCDHETFLSLRDWRAWRQLAIDGRFDLIRQNWRAVCCAAQVAAAAGMRAEHVGAELNLMEEMCEAKSAGPEVLKWKRISRRNERRNKQAIALCQRLVKEIRAVPVPTTTGREARIREIEAQIERMYAQLREERTGVGEPFVRSVPSDGTEGIIVPGSRKRPQKSPAVVDRDAPRWDEGAGT